VILVVLESLRLSMCIPSFSGGASCNTESLAGSPYKWQLSHSNILDAKLLFVFHSYFMEVWWKVSFNYKFHFGASHNTDSHLSRCGRGKSLLIAKFTIVHLAIQTRVSRG
jgi:hypothetical protein